MNKKYDLEERLVKFAGDTIIFLNNLPTNRSGLNLSDQLTRSATSSALNFGEAQGAESIKDQIHKLGICLKEIKESRVALKIIKYLKYGDSETGLKLLRESEELAAIIATVIKNKRKSN